MYFGEPSTVPSSVARSGGDLGDAEIHDLDVAIAPDHDVGGLYVPVHDLVFVRVVERARDALRDLADMRHRQHDAGVEELAQRLSLEVLHRDVGHIVGLAHVVDGDDVGMTEASRGLGFPVEALLEIGALLARELEADRLDRNGAFDHRVDRLVHCTHRTPAQDRDHFVPTDLLFDNHAGPRRVCACSGRFQVRESTDKV
jgi:hypothetical protein